MGRSSSDYSSSSSSSSDSDTEGRSVVGHFGKLFGGGHILHGKARDVLLWRDKKAAIISLSAATMIWILIEGTEYRFVTLVCHMLMALMVAIFLSFKLAPLATRSNMRFPRLSISEKAFLTAASAIRVEINKWLDMLYGVSSGKDLRKFFLVLFCFWFLSVIGSGCSFLTLCYIVYVLAHTVPVVCHKYGDVIDRGAYKAKFHMGKQYRRFDRSVLSKIPRGPVKSKNKKRK